MSKYKLLQWKFTACQHNIEGTNCFNTFSMSEELTAEDKADLCRKAGSYTPPDGLPFTPTKEEIKDLFPVVFSSFPLRSNKIAVVRTVYIGQSYAENRWGNFFSHALVFPSDSCAFYPIQLFDSTLFEDGLTPEELQIKTTPDFLSPIEIDEDSLRDFSTELPRFLGDEPTRPRILASLLNAVRDGHRSGKPLVLKDSSENIPMWLAAIQYAFPLRLAGGITFTTYAHSLSHGERFHITTTTDGKAFQIDSPAMSAANYVFDFSSDRFPVIPAKTSIFIDDTKFTDEIQCDGMQYPGGDMQKMQGFMQTLSCNISDDSLETAILSYKFLEWNIDPDVRDLQKVLDFCFQQNINFKKQIVHKVLQKDHVYDAGTLEMLLPKLVMVVQESKNNELVKMFLDFFVKQFENNVDPMFGWADGDTRFKVIDGFLKKYGRVGETLLQHVGRLVKQTSEAKKYVCLYYALILCLHSRDVASYFDSIRFLPLLEKNELEQFFAQALDFIVSKSNYAAIHKHTVGLYTKTCGCNTNFANRYLHIVKKYGTDQWKYGKPAEEQGTAFAKYVFNPYTKDGPNKDGSTKEEWSMWFGAVSVKHYYKTLTNRAFRTNQLWTIFDIDVSSLVVSAPASEKKKTWKHISNARNMIETFAGQDGKLRVRYMDMPTLWDRWGKIVILTALVGVTFTAILLIILSALFFSSQLSNVSTPNQQVNSKDSAEGMPHNPLPQIPDKQQPSQ